MDPNLRFEALEKRFFQEWVKRHPILGSSLGYHQEYDELMPDGTLDKEFDDQKFLLRWIDEFRRQDPKKLSPDLAVNRELALGMLHQWHFERATVRLWERSPEAPQVVGHALFQVLFRNYAPLKERMKSLLKRLEALPRYVEESKSRLRRPIKYYIENELETLTRLPGFFNTLRDISREHLGSSMERQMLKLIESAQNALEKYSDWLIVDVLPECGEQWPIGEEHFHGLLKARGIQESPAALLEMGEAEMARQLERMKEVGRQIKRKTPVEDVRDMVKAQHPDGSDAVLRFVRESLSKAKQFVNRSKFASIPEHDSIYVIETPSFLRHLLPLGGYWPPAKFETKRDGYVFVTPGDCDSDKLKEHNYAALTNLTVRLSYPGRHLMAEWVMHHPSPLRTFANAPETVVGWTYYVEERLKELGYENGAPSRFMQLSHAMTGAARMILDVKLSAGKMTPLQAVEFLIDHIGMDRVVAEGDVRRLTLYPTVGLTEFWGREQLKELKKNVKERLRSRFTEVFFHNAVLQSGGLPIRVLRKEMEWRVAEELARPVSKEPEKHSKAHKNSSDAAAPSAKKAAHKVRPKPEESAKAPQLASSKDRP
ncbi:MAG: DUF885 domain-containing protein [Planctomycetes bacterium]|nr:DUF885 domain-containing protein [Planctomycetota bacterium]